MTTVGRRRLLAGGAATAAAVTLGRVAPVTAQTSTVECVNDPDDRPSAVGTNLPKDRLGAQMFSVADQVQAIGWENLLPAMAEIGYDMIEFAGHGGGQPQQIRQILDDCGLTAIGNHGGQDDASIEAAAILGQPYTGIGALIPTHGIHTAGLQQTADELNAFGERASASGVKFYIHMHGPEYVRVADDPTRHVIDVLLEETDPRYVFWEMDIYWAYFFQSYVGGAGVLFDPLAWVTANPERFPLFHVKDGKLATTRQSVAGLEPSLMYAPVAKQPGQDGICDVGQGQIDFKSFFGALDVSQHHFIWERDTASDHPRGSLASARLSYLAMHFDHMAGRSAY